MLYRNEILEMDEGELLQLAAEHKLELDDPDYIDADEIIEQLEESTGKLFDSAEDDILDTICNGNWNDGAKQMLEQHVTPDSLVDYINDFRYEQYEEAYEWFDLSSAVAITDVYHMVKKMEVAA